MSETELLDRIEHLRAALEIIRDRDPQAQGVTEATSVVYSDEIRRYAEVALAEDDARIAAE
jgi:hypothetical protein